MNYCNAQDSNEVQVDIEINADNKLVQVSPDLYGIFFEEINHAGDGGLYAEMVQNRTFEEMVVPGNCFVEDGVLKTKTGWNSNVQIPSGLHAWLPVCLDGGNVVASIDASNPLNANTPHALKLEVLNAAGRAGIANEGYWGMSLIEGDNYDLSFYARTEQEKLNVTASLESADGKTIYAKSVISEVGGQWDQYTCRLKSSGTDPKARLVLCVDRPATIWFDVVSLFPEKTYKNRKNGLRCDLMQMLEGLHPKFVRFPGGCVVEGCTLDDRVQWKKTIGPIAQRSGHWSLWGYRTTDGLGFHEFLQMAEDLGAGAMYVVNVGMSCQARGPEIVADAKELTEVYLQDTLDALEYAMGPVTSKWGAIRAQNGHPKPFKIKYLEIGNENSGPDYARNYPIFYAGIKAKYPEIITIANEIVSGSPVEVVDLHYYVDPASFVLFPDIYKKADRNGPKIYVGEYAGNNNVGTGNLFGALAEGVFIMNMENNSDIVKMASYAPLFENVNSRNWAVNLIRLDSSRVVGRSSYYVQKVFAENLPSSMVESKVIAQPVFFKNEGKVGLRTIDADAEFKDIRITRGTETLYASDFSKGASEWDKKSGVWVVENGVLRQKDIHPWSYAILENYNFGNCTIELKIRRVGGNNGIMVLFQKQGAFQLQWNLGGWRNTMHTLQAEADAFNTAISQKPGTIDTGRWYDVKIVLNGQHVDCYLDNELIHSEDVLFETRPCFANAGIDDKTGELIIKMLNPGRQTISAKLKINSNMKISSSAKVTTITGKDGIDENTLEEPFKIYPKTSVFEGGSPDFEYKLSPWSMTVLRMGLQK